MLVEGHLQTLIGITVLHTDCASIGNPHGFVLHQDLAAGFEYKLASDGGAATLEQHILILERERAADRIACHIDVAGGRQIEVVPKTSDKVGRRLISRQRLICAGVAAEWTKSDKSIGREIGRASCR